MNFLKIRNLRNNYYAIILCIIVLLLPYSISITNIFIIILSLLWLKDFFIYKYQKTLKQNIKYILPLLILFLFYLISTFYSSDFKAALKLLERRIPIFLLPLIISSIPFNKKEIENIFCCFVLSIAVCCFTALFFTINYFFNHPNEYYLEKALWLMPQTIGFHAPYLALYLVISNIFCYYFLLQKKKLKISVSFLLINNIFLLIISSRMALAVNWILIIFLSSLYLYESKGKIITLINAVAILAVLFLAYTQIPYLHTKISKITEAAYGVSHRVVSAEAALLVIKSNLFFGVGVADVQIELSKNLSDPSYSKYNVHNQYLHELMTYGLVGFIFFISIFVVGFYIAIANKDEVFALFLGIFLLLFVTEVIMARYKGIMLFSLFYPLLVSLSYQKNIIKIR